MKILCLFPGKIKPAALDPAQKEYEKRLKSLGVEILEYKEAKISGQSNERIKETEAERILKTLKPTDYVVACDERGSSLSTQGLAELLKAAITSSHPLEGKTRIVVIVGGALGLHESVRKKAQEVWQLSSLVMAGGIARVVLLEGIYRAFTILNNHPYHNA